MQQSSPLDSYAQNAEDVVLWRGLGHIERGTYIDVGAAHPFVDNVTMLFYEKGWSGLNVEPDPEHFGLLRRLRARDTNMNVGAGAKSGEMSFFRIPETGYSTFDRDLARHWTSRGFRCEELRRPVLTLNEMIAKAGLGDIHFLKIDVEGFEGQVLEGLDLRRHRPWILVIEATEPQTNRLTSASWEAPLAAAGYRRCLFDGINLFFCAEEHAELAARISFPANVIDNYRSRAVVALDRQLKERDQLGEALRRAVIFAHDRAAKVPEPLAPSGQAASKPPLIRNGDGARKPSLFVDITCLKRTQMVTGIQRVTLNIAACLKRLSAISGFEIVFVVFDGQDHRKVELEITGALPSVVRIGDPGEPITLLAPDQWLSCELNSVDLVANFEWYRRLKRAGIGLNFWIYDLFPVVRPDWSPDVETLRFQAWLERLLAIADLVICDSAKVARDVEKWMALFPPELLKGATRPAVTHLHLGADGIENALLASHEGFEFASAHPHAMRGQAEATFVSVASLHPRKALGAVIEAFEMLWAKGREIDLVLTGMPSNADNLKQRLLRHPRRNRNLFYEGYVDDSEVRRLYADADALIVASFDEGFGLPIVEAAHRGLPSIARDIQVFREVGGDDLFYFEDAGPAALAAAIENWLALAPDARRRAIPPARLLTWDQVTRRLLGFMAEGVAASIGRLRAAQSR